MIAALVAAGGDDVLDVHRDSDHNRAVLTLYGEAAPRAVAEEAVRLIDVRAHAGAHPRIGAVDVVPFAPLGDTPFDEAIAARDRFARWAGEALALPCFLYGPERTLPDIRRAAFSSLGPDTGPAAPHPTAGACAVGARPVLVAYNLWLADSDLASAREIARGLRGPAVRALGLQVGRSVQVSLNLVDPMVVGPAAAHDMVAARARIARAELVGLVPEAVLRAVPQARWAQLDLDAERTIEARLARRQSL